MAQGIRFALEAKKDRDGLGTLRGLGLFDNVYSESNIDLLARLGPNEDSDDDDYPKEGMLLDILSIQFNSQFFRTISQIKLPFTVAI